MPVTLILGRRYYVRGGLEIAINGEPRAMHSNRTAHVVGEENGMYRVEHGAPDNPRYFYHYGDGRTDRFSMTEFDLMAEVPGQAPRQAAQPAERPLSFENAYRFVIGRSRIVVPPDDAQADGKPSAPPPTKQQRRDALPLLPEAFPEKGHGDA